MESNWEAIIGLIDELSDVIYDYYESRGIEYDETCELVDMLHDEVYEEVAA